MATLLLAPGQLGWQEIDAVTEPDPLDGRPRAGLPTAAGAPRYTQQRHVFQHRPVRQQAEAGTRIRCVGSAVLRARPPTVCSV